MVVTVRSKPHFLLKGRSGAFFVPGRMEEWKDGRLEECDNSTIRQFDNGRMEEWKVGRMEEWKNVIIRQFDNGRMERWKNGRM